MTGLGEIVAAKVEPRRRFTRSTYLMARCTGGCEIWLHPKAVRNHLDLGRCRGRPWVDEIPAAALVQNDVAELFAEELPARYLTLRPYTSVATERAHKHLPDLLVSSPIEGVAARRWTLIAAAAVRRDGAEALRVAMTAEGFEQLAVGLAIDEWLTDCPDCGETVTRSHLEYHRSRSTRCRWTRAAVEVRRLFAEGWRDPVSVTGAPADWTGLQARVAWRRRTLTVDFPRWVAVLLAPDAPVDRRSTQ